MYLLTSQARNSCEMPAIYYRLVHTLTKNIACTIFGWEDVLDQDPKEVILLLIKDQPSGFL